MSQGTVLSSCIQLVIKYATLWSLIFGNLDLSSDDCKLAVLNLLQFYWQAYVTVVHLKLYRSRFQKLVLHRVWRFSFIFPQVGQIWKIERWFLLGSYSQELWENLSKIIILPYIDTKEFDKSFVTFSCNMKMICFQWLILL